MIKFAHPEYLYLLTALPLLVLGYWLLTRARRKALANFGELSILGRLTESASASKRLVKFLVLLLAGVFLIVGLANPRIGTRLQEVKQEGVDICIALDVSLSMKSEDIKPNRLEKAKLEIGSLIDRLAGDRLGLVVFGGEAYTQFPLTTDYSAARVFLDVIDVDVVPVPGTSISSAIQRSTDSFDFEDPTTKVLVIITDGEETDGDGLSDAQEAGKKGVRIYTIGMGSPTGAPIPVYNAGGQHVDFKRDASGSVVVSKLDEPALERIADAGHGEYYRATNTQDELNEIYKSINALQKREFGVKQFTDFEDRFQPFLAVGIVLLLVELFLSEKRIRWIARWNPLRRAEEVKV